MENRQPVNTKICKYCKTEIPITATICPQCRKKQNGNGLWIALGVVAFIFWMGLSGGDSDSTDKGEGNTQNVGGTNSSQNESKPEIVYEKVTVDELLNLLEENALKAEKQYQDKYVEVTGTLEIIDSDGEYISLGYTDGSFTMTHVQCFIENDKQVDKVLEMKKGDIVTLKGKITSIGEIIGYKLSIDSIN